MSCVKAELTVQELKLRYYDLIVQLALQEDGYLEACSAYQEVWDTEEVKKDEARELNVRAVICCEAKLTHRSSRTSSSMSSWRHTTMSSRTCCTSCTTIQHCKRRPYTSA